MSRIDVFRNFPQSKSKPSASLNERGMRKFEPKNKKDLSDSEIREKVKAHHDKKNGPLKKAKIKGQKLGESFMNADKIKPPKQNLVKMQKSEGAKEADPKKEAVVGDIKPNDPNDTNTTEKLKGLLSTGGFNFSEKERETLGKILNG